jgi:hypothetical protein
MNRILIVEATAMHEAIKRLEAEGRKVILPEMPIIGVDEMRMNARLLAAALMSGLVTAGPLARSPETVAESMGEFSPTRPRYHAPRRSNVAQAKRAKTKRRNIAKHPGCNGHHRLRR